jgi:transposase
MARSKDTQIIRVLHPICCGLDVHKKTISACLLTLDAEGNQEFEIREFATFTKDLFELKNWLLEKACPIVAIESTGVYWRPVHNVLEGSIEVLLVNARHVKNIPGRKTDLSDCAWLASLLQHGFLKGSFIPEKKVRQWRELERLRRTHTETAADYKRRVHKLFETANIKIDSVVSDLFGVTGRNLIALICDEQTQFNAEVIRQCAKGALKFKVDELLISLQGFFEDHHRFQLKGMMRIISELEQQIEFITKRLRELMKPHQELINRLDEIPGINEIAAQSIISHIGVTMKEFPRDAALCQWSGLCCGNNQSAGKRKSGRSPVRSHPFKTIMTEVAWAAIKKRGSYYKEKYFRMKARITPKKAIIAVAHRITKAIYYMIKGGESFRDLGEDYLYEKQKVSRISKLRKYARKLGFILVPINS